MNNPMESGKLKLVITDIYIISIAWVIAFLGVLSKNSELKSASSPLVVEAMAISSIVPFLQGMATGITIIFLCNMIRKLTNIKVVWWERLFFTSTAIIFVITMVLYLRTYYEW